MDFGAMFQTWINVLTRPNEETFQEERQKSHATLTTALIWIAVAAFIAAIFSIIGSLVGAALGGGASLIQGFLNQADVPPEVRQQLLPLLGGGAAVAGGGLFAAFCTALILAPIGFLIGSAIYWVVAKLFGGEGSFEEQTYLLATFSAPLMVVNGVVSVVPYLGGCVSFLISLYQLVLSYFAIKVSHDLTPGKAIAVIILPVAVVFICVICLAVVMLLVLGPALGDAFGNL
ncbi:MAG: YIP1 family protein [Caldilineae bacterium]|nr:MAG: YIP1 family protein [Caldilineae bacterium]